LSDCGEELGSSISNGKEPKTEIISHNNNHIITFDTLTCMYVNARSLVNKRDELELIAEQEDYSIIGITETWLTDSIENAEIELEGYKMLRKDRVSPIKTRGGGVLFYIKEYINVVQRDDICSTLFPESLFCTIESNGEKSLLGICYRPPDSTVDNDSGLFNLFEQACRDCNNCVILGDFNFKELACDKPESLSDDHPFINCMNDNFMHQLVVEPSRNENFLDLIFSSDENIIENVVIREPFGTSDHNIIDFKLVISKIPTDKGVRNFNFHRANYHDIVEAALHKDWDNIVLDNVNDIWLCIKSDILQIRNNLVPLTGKSKVKCKWTTKAVRKRRRAKRRAWDRYISSGKKKTLYDNYKKKLYMSIKTNEHAKRQFEAKLANNVKIDSKSFFAYVRSKERNKVKVGPLRDAAGSIITDDKVTANILNDYFASVFTVENIDNIPVAEQVFIGLESEYLSEISINEEIIFKKLSEINVNKSPGSDDLHPKLLFELRHQLVSPLTKLFKLSLENGIVPQE
jgi:Endonuclease-reverse transcriptase